MKINTHEKSEVLLKAIANSLYDRDPSNEKPIYFSISEVNLVDKFLQDILEEYDS
jgi:hypothetical protein